MHLVFDHLGRASYDSSYPLNYWYVSFLYTLVFRMHFLRVYFYIQDACFMNCKSVLYFARSADCVKHPPKTPHDPCRRPTER